MYIKKDMLLQNLILSVILLASLLLMDFNQSMSPGWVGPYLSAAANFDLSSFTLYVNMDDVKQFGQLSADAQFAYTFPSNKETIVYDYLAKGFLFILLFAKTMFFFLGDLEAVQYLQYLVHFFVVFGTMNLLDTNYKKVLFFIFYGINPVVLYFVNYPFYYFWQVVASSLFIYWYFNQEKIKNLIFLFSTVFAFIYITRPTVLFLIILFYILYSIKNDFKKGLVGFAVFLALINLAPNLSIGPWHTMYVGIGAYENKYKIALSDEEGYKYYKEQTGKTINSDNILNINIKDEYYQLLQERYVKIVQENPAMLLRNAILNILQSYSIGYMTGHPFINYLSAMLGLIIIGLLLYTRQYILFLAIGMASGGFTPYYPPIAAYMYGSYLLIVIGGIGIIDFLILQYKTKKMKKF